MPGLSRPEPASTERMVDYDRHSQMQDQMVRTNAERLRVLVERIGAVEPPFTMVDYGCGPGQSALHSVRPVIEAYRRLDPRGRMVIRHADQPGNDWNALLALVFGPDGYQASAADIRTEAVVGSFYQPMAEPGSVTLATCFAASHWLSRAIAPCSPGTVWFADLEGEARAEMAALARADWTRFLRCRALELRAGGFAVVATLGSVPDTSEPNGVRASASRLYRAIFQVADQMVRAGSLAQTALDRFVFPLWFPTAAEIQAPIACEPDLAEAFEIVEAGVAPVRPHGADVYEDALADPATYARLYAGYVRGFGELSLRLHLFRHCAPDAAALDRLTEEFFRRFTRLYQDEPGRHASETMIVTLVIRRR